MNQHSIEERQPRTPTLAERTVIALGFAVVAGALAWYVQIRAGANGGDFRVLWRAARIVLEGGDPYQIVHWHGEILLPNAARRYFYPLPAFGMALPFALLPPAYAAIGFVFGSAAFLGFVITKDSFDYVPVLLAVPFLECAEFGQTSILMVALALTRSAAGFTLMKPNIGIALFAWRPRYRTIVVAGALFIGSVIVSPSWPVHWLTLARSSYMHRPPIATWFGAIGLLGLLRWRRPEARLLAAMTLIPHALYFYDELPLFLIPQTRRESMALVLCSWLGLAATLAGRSADADILRMHRWVVASLYIPAALMVIRRPNVPPVAEPTAPSAEEPPR